MKIFINGESTSPILISVNQGMNFGQLREEVVEEDEALILKGKAFER